MDADALSKFRSEVRRILSGTPADGIVPPKESLGPKEIERLCRRVARLEKEVSNWERKRLSPREIVASSRVGASEFDDGGIPTKDRSGNALPASVRRRMERLIETQRKNNRAYEEKVAKQGVSFLERLKIELAEKKEILARSGADFALAPRVSVLKFVVPE